MNAEYDDDLETDENEIGGPSEDEVRTALRALHAGNEATLGDVILLCVANDDYAVQIVPQPAIDAVFAKYEMDRDVDNGGMDQVVWNYGSDQARQFAAAFRAVGAVENADLLDRLALVLDDYHTKVSGEEISADPVTHFRAFRRLVNGPSFGIPEPGEELAEPLLEFVLDRADQLPDADGPLPRVAQ